MIEVVDEAASNTRATARDRTAQAIHYYNNNVLKARTGSKSSSYSYQQLRFRGGTSSHSRPDNLYRSNSNLELLHDINSNECHLSNRGENNSNPPLKREYGSHGSIDVIPVVDQIKNKNDVSEQFFRMLQEYKPAALDLVRNNRHCDKNLAEYDTVDVNFKKSENPISYSGTILDKVEDDYSYSSKTVATSPKPKSKFPKFWSTGNMGNSSKSSNNDSPTSMIPVVIAHHNYNLIANTTISGTNNVDVDEKQRRRAFAHYDCQSLIAKLGHDKLKSMLSKRRNTTTGASAASMIGARSTTPDGDTGEDDPGDGRCNDLIESCPFFRNEIGGEEERIVSLTRSYSPSHSKHWKDPHHRPPLSSGISILEYPAGETHWINDTCPYRRCSKMIDNVDEGALYYRKHFYKQEHQNWFGIDETLGPVAISIKKEKVDANSQTDFSSNNISNANGINQISRYRLVIRTSELQTLRGSVLEDVIPNLKPSHNIKSINTKEVLDYVIPEIQLSCLRLGVNSPQIEEQLLKLDEQGISRHYKIGVLYCRAGQATEEEMYNNEEGGPAFNEFLETIGQKVRLKGFDKYKAGLDNKSDSTGLYSIYSQYKNCEIMFHVSTMLPFTLNNRQQLLRKRHIGNDIVTIVFQEPGAQPFTPKNIRSQFQHVFIIVRVINPCSDCTQYRIAVTRSKDVALFGPPIPKHATFNKSKTFADFLLTKVINGENAAHCSDKFATMATRTRQAYLKDLTTNCASNTLLENSQKFSIISFSSKKKERWRPRIVHDSTQRGAICWQVKLEDSIQSINIHCFLAISTDSLVLIDENASDIVFVTPCKSILGWSTQTNSLRLYYHAGECVIMHMRESSDRDELMEVVSRLKYVTPGSPALELSLKRNTVGQLGFHVQPDGVITQVENMGFAWQAGLRQGARLVEICKVAVATLTHDQMVDLLKTSLMVTVTVIPPLTDSVPRRGCSVQNCKYNSMDEKEEYENCSSPEDKKFVLCNTASLQQPVIGKHKKMYERNFSPPRSSNSSGYGTGGSNRSYGGGIASNKNNNSDYNNGDALPNIVPSGQSSGDRWYDVLDPDSLPTTLRNNLSPPPLPARVIANVIPSTSRSLHKYSPHSKMKLSSALNISNSNTLYSLPAVLNGESDLDYFKTKEDFNSNEKITCLMKAEYDYKARNNLDAKFRNSEFKIDGYGGKDDKSSSLPSENLKVLFLTDGHSTDTSSTSEKAFPPSEDELSIESNGNASPKLKSTIRSTSSNSNNCSRNNSPRLKDIGEPRLRPSVSSRSSNRNSANLASSTLQQDLIKLINPDDVQQNLDEENKTCHTQQFLNIANEISMKNLPSEEFKMKENTPPIQKNSTNDNIVILTTARPATVISNSSRLNENYMSKEERLSLRVTNISNSKHDSSNILLSDITEVDWPSLVDTASKATRQSSSDENPSSLLSTMSDDLQWIDNSNESHFNVHSETNIEKNTLQQFQKYLSELENRLMKETQRRLALENEVHSLRDENRRLQQESQNAAQQLRRFTEWFFQTIDKQ